ncbi:MAG: AMP-binding protein [Polyangia bacterium]
MSDTHAASWSPERYRLGLCRPNLTIPTCRYDELLSQTAARLPDRFAIIHRDVALTFRALDALVNSGARILRGALDLRSGEIVAVVMETCPESLIAYQGVSRAGGVVLPLNPLHREQELAHQLDDSGAVVLVVPARLHGLAMRLKESHAKLRSVLWYGCAPAGSEPPADTHYNRLLAVTPGDALAPPARSAGDLLAIPYSSGTTGTPKGVMLTHRNLVANALQFVNAHGLSDQDVMLDGLPLLLSMHMGGGIAAGATQVMLIEWSARHLLEASARHGVTQIYTVTPILGELDRLPDLEEYVLPKVKFIAGGASSLAADLALRVEQRIGVPIMQGFGLTEASPLTHAAMPRSEQERRIGVCGLPVANTEQRIVDIETGERELPHGTIGHLCVRGPQVMAGYFKDEAETRRVLRDGWLYTGDLCWCDGDGYLHYADRLKDVLKFQGHTISPAELEHVLRKHAGVSDCAVVGIDTGPDEQRPVAFVVPALAHAVEPEELRDFVNTQVADYKHVLAVRTITQIPRSGAGKILRRQLRQQVAVLSASALPTS